MQYQDLESGEMKHQIENWPILDPHSVISFLFDKAKLKIPAVHIRKYWEHHCAHGEEWAQRPETHAMVPLGIFGDAAKITLQTGATVNILGLFMSVVLFRPRSIRASRYLLFAIGDHQLWKHFTLTKVLRRLTWSFNALYHGHHPHLDPYGKALPAHLEKLAGSPITFDHMRFCVTEVRGDWSWRKKVWRYGNKTAWNGINICHWCRAKSKGAWPDLYWNMTDESNWHNANFSLEEFMDERLPSHGICGWDIILR